MSLVIFACCVINGHLTQSLNELEDAGAQMGKIRMHTSESQQKNIA